MRIYALACTLLLFVVLSCVSTIVHAADITSSSFIIRDPLIGTGGGYQSSGSFTLFGTGDTTLTGESSSTSFLGRFGFQYYPYVQSGTLSASVVNASQVDLSWNASTAGLGLSVSGYKIGVAAVSGGPYTDTTLGAVTTYSYTNLLPGTYFFRLQTLDAFGAVIATSNEVQATVSQVLSFSLSDNTIGFGNLSTSTARFATGDAIGSNSETEAHQLVVTTNAASGYVLSVQGNTLTSGSNSVLAIGATNTASIIGTEQFGIRYVASGGTGTVQSPYDSSGFAYDATSTTSSTVGGATAGNGVATTYSARYLTNISSVTESGAYSTTLTYILTAQY